MNYFFLLIAVLAVGFSGPFNTLAVGPGGFSGIQTASFRLLIASFLLLLLPITRHHFTEAWRYRSKIFKGALLLALHFALWTSAFQFTSLSSAVVFLCAQPVISLALTFHLKKERPTKTMIGGLFIATIGLFLLAWGDFLLTGQALIGDFMVVLACFAIVFYQLTIREASQKIPWATFNFLIWALSGLILLPFACLYLDLSETHALGWKMVVALALIPTIMGHGCFNYIIPKLKLFLLNIAILSEPILAIFIGIAMNLDEIPQNERLCGVFFVIFGVGLVFCSEGYQVMISQKKERKM